MICLTPFASFATEFQKLSASDASSNENFGFKVAVSGDTALVSSIEGNAYIFTKTGGIWSQAGKLLTSDSAEGDFFAYSIALSGDTAIVGAYQDDDNAFDSGSVYVFVKPSEGWSDMTETAKLHASDASASDEFGYSVAIDGDLVVIGARYDGSNNSGSAYLFQKPIGGWGNMTESAKLTASASFSGDEFGSNVAISGNTIVIGVPNNDSNGTSSGKVYLFEEPVGGWENMTETAQLEASDAAANDYFGSSVAISGETVLIAAYGDDDNGSNSGSAYIFAKPIGRWENSTETGKLTASDGETSDYFGCSVAISGNFAIIGARGDDDNGSYSGSAYFFEKPVGGWSNSTETSKLTSNDGDGGDQVWCFCFNRR